jgi:peptidoglycan/LPS O-acetylase OafA/YrhL
MRTTEPGILPADRRGPRIVALVAGVLLVLLGLWAFAAPRSFFDAVATYEPYNAHFVRDLGAFQFGLGMTLALVARMRDGLRAALLGVGGGALLHVSGHVLDRDMGGTPAVDIPFLAIMAVALLIAAVYAGRRA